MPRITPTFHRIDRMASDAREVLIRQLVAVDDAVFSEATPAHVLASYRGHNVDGCWVMALRRGDQVVGYNVVRLWFDHVDGRRIGLWRSRAAVLPDYRRSSMTAPFASLLFVWFRLRYPRMPLYTINTLIHPSSFRLFATHVASLYPFPKATLSDGDQRIYDRAIERFGLERIAGCADFIVQDPTVVQTSPVEASRWANSDAECVRFFLEHNPEYGQGRAVASFLPLTARVVLGFSYRLLVRRLQRTRRRWIGIRPQTDVLGVAHSADASVTP